MPQMAPMNWIFMSSSFILTLIIILSLIHSFYMVNKTDTSPNIPMEQMKWKW